MDISEFNETHGLPFYVAPSKLCMAHHGYGVSCEGFVAGPQAYGHAHVYVRQPMTKGNPLTRHSLLFIHLIILQKFAYA
jgi:hypothetical protein